VILTILAALAAAAAPAPDDKPDCDDPQTQFEMNVCAAIDFEAADAELNRMWKEVVAAARSNDADFDWQSVKRPTTEQVLRDAQRAWIRLRDSHCTYEGYEALGGSMEPMLYNGCRARLTRERIEQLRPQEAR